MSLNGFSVTKIFFNSINDEDLYSINLETSFEEGTMKVLEYVLHGESEDSIIMNAHNCHAFCCNDDLSGVAVGIEVIRNLAKIIIIRQSHTDEKLKSLTIFFNISDLSLFV